MLISCQKKAFVEMKIDCYSPPLETARLLHGLDGVRGENDAFDAGEGATT